MKIYISNYEPYHLSEILQTLEKYYTETELKYELYSEEGIYIANDKNTFKLKINMDKTEKIQKYIGDWDVWVDNSDIQYEIAYQVPPDAINIPVVSIEFKLHKNAKTKLIVEGCYDLNNLRLLTKTNKYKGFIVNNFYFEVLDNTKNTKNNTNINIQNNDIKNEINEFLSYFK